MFLFWILKVLILEALATMTGGLCVILKNKAAVRVCFLFPFFSSGLYLYSAEYFEDCKIQCTTSICSRYSAFIFLTLFHMLYFLQINFRKVLWFIYVFLETITLDTNTSTQHFSDNVQYYYFMQFFLNRLPLLRMITYSAYIIICGIDF